LSIGIGEALRSAREEQGRSVEEAARATRVRSDYIHALEEEEFAIFGGDVYAKGFLQSYARYLGVDEQPLLDAYRRYVQHDDYDPRRLAARPVAQAPRAPLPGWVLWAGIGVAVLIIAIAAANVLGGRTPEPAAVPTAPATSLSPSPSVRPSLSPSPSPTFDDIDLVVLVEESCWIEATVDGAVVEAGRVYEPGETLSLEADEVVEITFGNAGGVRVEHNGRDLGPPGPRGGVVTATYDPSGRVDAGEDAAGGEAEPTTTDPATTDPA
jgi:cytoskeletal protein RodZ